MSMVKKTKSQFDSNPDLFRELYIWAFDFLKEKPTARSMGPDTAMVRACAVGLCASSLRPRAASRVAALFLSGLGLCALHIVAVCALAGKADGAVVLVVSLCCTGRVAGAV